MRVGSKCCVVLLTWSLVLSGCASLPESRSFNIHDSADVRRIAVLPMRQAEVDLQIVNNPGYSFGLIGLGIAEANRVPKRNWLRERVSMAKFDFAGRFKQALTEAMAARGFELLWPGRLVDSDTAGTPRLSNGLRKSYSPAEVVDAQLDVNVGFIGYAAAGSGDSAPYRPTMTVAARLISGDGTQVLFSDHIVYNNVYGAKNGGIVLDPDPDYRYPDFDDMKAADEQTVAGLVVAVDSVARALADQFGSAQ